MRGRKYSFITAAWLALLSVALLFFAPVLSKSLAQRTLCPPAGPTAIMDVSAHHDMGMMTDVAHDRFPYSRCAEASTMDFRMKSGQAMSPMEDIVCGYCQLLIHLPFVQFLLTALFGLLILFVCRIPVPDIICTPRFRAWTPQRARAPPTDLFLRCNAL